MELLQRIELQFRGRTRKLTRKDKESRDRTGKPSASRRSPLTASRCDLEQGKRRTEQRLAVCLFKVSAGSCTQQPSILIAARDWSARSSRSACTSSRLDCEWKLACRARASSNLEEVSRRRAQLAADFPIRNVDSRATDQTFDKTAAKRSQCAVRPHQTRRKGMRTLMSSRARRVMLHICSNRDSTSGHRRPCYHRPTVSVILR